MKNVSAGLAGNGPLAGYLITRFGYPDVFLSASSAAICGCLIVTVLLYNVREHQAREFNSWARTSGI